MKTLRYFFVAALAMVGMNALAEDSFDFTAQGYENGSDVPTMNLTNATITWDANGASNAPKWYNASTAVRIYAKNKVTFTATKAIKVIKFTLSSDGLINENNNGFDSGEYDAENTKWTGNATTLVLHNKATSGNQIRIQKLTIYYEGDEIPGDVHIANTEETAYTVAKAFELIDAGQALSETVFVKGVISQIDNFNETYGSITYWISDDGTTAKQLECYAGLNKDGVKFTSIEDIAVGASVIVKGTLTKYAPAQGDPIYEFNMNNQLVKYEAGGDTPESDGYVGIYRPLDLTPSSGPEVGNCATKTSYGVTVTAIKGTAATYREEAGQEIPYTDGLYLGYSLTDKPEDNKAGAAVFAPNEVIYPVVAEQSSRQDEEYFGFKMEIPEGKSINIDELDVYLLAGNAYQWQVVITDAQGTEVYATQNVNNKGIKINNYNKTAYTNGVTVTRTAVTEPAWSQAILASWSLASNYDVADTPVLPALDNLQGTYFVKVYYWGKWQKNLTYANVLLKVSEGTSGIAAVKSANKVAGNQMYNLAGQKVGKDYKGIVIMNGKKFMNK